MQTQPALVAIVEDDPAMRKSIERLLQANGYATISFESAEEFLRASITERAIGVILDIHLDGMSGIDLRRHLAAGKSAIPVVFITARDDEATRKEALAAGCVDYLRKPFEATRLIEAIERGRSH